MLTSYFDTTELLKMGFRSLGKDVKLSRKASIYNPKDISIGDYSRIDDFCVISAGEGGIDIGRNVHIAVYVLMMGKAKISLGDFSGLSSRVSIYSSNDDYSGEAMTNPTVDSKYTNVYSSPVTIGEHVIIGSGSVVLPGITVGRGTSVGALTIVNKDCAEFKVYIGSPMRCLKDRSRNLLLHEIKLLKDEG